tara:strand:- start:780 stop:1532 length:753 start_codon:yes stop_codon:yes gene_type:complete
MRKAIFQKSIPYDWQKVRKLPGVMPLNPHEWIIFDDAYNDQMVEREKLLQNNNDVIVFDNNGQAVARELLSTLLQFLRKVADFKVSEKQVITRDSRTVKIDYDKPLMTCGLLVQNDFCLMEKRNGQHVLSAAVLCFPANWRLLEKFMKPLFSIHKNVPEYSSEIEKRVNRIFDGIRVGQPMWRFNVLEYSDPTLYQPYRLSCDQATSYIRSERQTFLKLPETDAVVFGIHTFILKKVPSDTFKNKIYNNP